MMTFSLNGKYSTGLIADTDLHAGGVFFCLIYKKTLVFSDNGVVRFSRELVDPFRPMDDSEVEVFQNDRHEGKYFLNNNQNVECHFEDIGLELTGRPTKKDPEVLAFHAYNKQGNREWGEVYVLEK